MDERPSPPHRVIPMLSFFVVDGSATLGRLRGYKAAPPSQCK
jgi:hypothetical protein